MDPFRIQATRYTPSVNFNPHDNTFDLIGESFPENPTRFFNPILTFLDDYFTQPESSILTVNIELTYYNSRSSRLVMDLLDSLNLEAQKGRTITVNWRCRKSNEDIMEDGCEFKETFTDLVFNMVYLP